jgi:hypothetical protein
VSTALVVVAVSLSAWSVLGLYSGLEQLGARSHPVVDFLGWVSLGVAALAVIALALEVFDAWVTGRFRRRGRGS